MTTLLNLAIEAAIHAGNKILSIYNDPNLDFQVEKKSDNSPLTIADKASNNIIVTLLENSNIPILSEENTEIAFEQRKNWKQLWIVDPLDGTKEFIKRNGEFTVNIALIEDNNPIMGVIYVPVKQILYFGDLTHGAYRCEITTEGPIPSVKDLIHYGKRLPLQSHSTNYHVVASRSHMSQETETFINTLKVQHSHIETISIGSSLKICLVAEGTADIYPRFAPTMEWDTAAGHAIAKAAGKNIYLIDGETPLTYNRQDLLNPWFIVK